MGFDWSLGVTGCCRSCEGLSGEGGGREREDASVRRVWGGRRRGRFVLPARFRVFSSSSNEEEDGKIRSGSRE